MQLGERGRYPVLLGKDRVAIHSWSSRTTATTSRMSSARRASRFWLPCSDSLDSALQFVGKHHLRQFTLGVGVPRGVLLIEVEIFELNLGWV